MSQFFIDFFYYWLFIQSKFNEHPGYQIANFAVQKHFCILFKYSELILETLCTKWIQTSQFFICRFFDWFLIQSRFNEHPG